jgi:cytochrome c551/c552
MKKLILSLSVFVLFLIDGSADAAVNKGKVIFEKKGCAVCHKQDVDAIGPSLLTISKAYAGKGNELVSYLKSKSKPIIEPKRASVMNPQLVKIQVLSDKDMKALASYISIPIKTPLY